MKVLSLSLLLLILSACTTKVEIDPQFNEGDFDESPSTFEPPQGELLPEYFESVYQGEHIISEGDFLEVSVIGEPDTVINKVPVSPDGYLYYLMSKPIYAAGKKVGALRQDLEASLAGFFENPKVYVRVHTRNHDSFQILGKVNQPGEYNLDLPVKLREAVTLAGGLKRGQHRLEQVNLADLANSYIIRNGKKLPINFKKLFNEGNQKENIFIRPKDYIYIASAVIEEVYILGDVNSARAVIYKNNLTALKLLTEAKFNKDSHLSGAIILRKSLEKPQILEVNLEKMLYGEEKDVYLEPGDILYIPEDPYKFVKEVAELALRAFVQTFASEAGAFYGDRRIYNR